MKGHQQQGEQKRFRSDRTCVCSSGWANVVVMRVKAVLTEATFRPNFRIFRIFREAENRDSEFKIEGKVRITVSMLPSYGFCTLVKVITLFSSLSWFPIWGERKNGKSRTQTASSRTTLIAARTECGVLHTGSFKSVTVSLSLMWYWRNPECRLCVEMQRCSWLAQHSSPLNRQCLIDKNQLGSRVQSCGSMWPTLRLHNILLTRYPSLLPHNTSRQDTLSIYVACAFFDVRYLCTLRILDSAIQEADHLTGYCHWGAVCATWSAVRSNEECALGFKIERWTRTPSESGV